MFISMSLGLFMRMLPPRLRVKVVRIMDDPGAHEWRPPGSLQEVSEAFKEADKLYEEQARKMNGLSIKFRDEYEWARPPPAITEITPEKLALLPAREPGRPAKIRYHGKTYVMVVEPPCG